MSEIPVHAVIMRRNGLPEEPGYRNDGLLRISDDELQVTTTWWNWARHMAWPLGLITSDLSVIFAGPTTEQEVVLTIRRDQLASIVMRPDAQPLPRVEITGTSAEDGKRWLCSFAYDRARAAEVDRLATYLPAERPAAGGASA